MRRSGSTGAGVRPCFAQWNHSATLSTVRVHSPPSGTAASGMSGARAITSPVASATLSSPTGLPAAHGGALAAAHGRVDIVRHADRGKLARRLVYARFQHRLARRLDAEGLEKSVAVVQQCGTGVLARLDAGGTHDHRHQPHAVAVGGSREAVAGAVGVPGLQTVDRGVLAQQAVAVVLADVVPHEFPQAEQRIELRELADQGVGEGRRVACRGVVIRRGHTVAVLEVARFHAEAARVLVHHLRDRRFRAADFLRERDAGVVPGLYDHALDENVHRDLRTDLHETARTPGTPGVLAY